MPVVLTKGTIEYIQVPVKDKKSLLTTLSDKSPMYDVIRKDGTIMLSNGVPAVEDMTLYCMVDSTGVTWTLTTYDLYVKFNVLPEIPRLGPLEFELRL